MSPEETEENKKLAREIVIAARVIAVRDLICVMAEQLKMKINGLSPGDFLEQEERKNCDSLLRVIENTDPATAAFVNEYLDSSLMSGTDETD